MATYSGRLVVARVFFKVALLSCSADIVFILGTQYLYLRALRLRTSEVCCKRTHQYVPVFAGLLTRKSDTIKKNLIQANFKSGRQITT